LLEIIQGYFFGAYFIIIFEKKLFYLLRVFQVIK
jgi:hypothetical protein